MRLQKTVLLVGMAFAAMTSAGNAQPLQFDYSGTVSLSFSLDSMPTPSSFDAFNAYFDNVPTVVNGDTVNVQYLDYDFNRLGVLEVTYYLGSLQFNSFDPLFSGTTAHPIFSNATIGGVEVTPNQDSGTLIISGGMSTVPLPASAPLFGAALLAFGAAGYGLRRKAAAA